MKFLNKKIIGIGLLGVFLFAGGIIYFSEKLNNVDKVQNEKKSFREDVLSSPTPSDVEIQIPERFIIPMRHHTFQTFNNCGPATLSMALSYWDVNISQHELGNILRPYQVAKGDNDDKSVTLEEVARQAEVYGLHAYLRPNGTLEKIEKFISQEIPVVTRTRLEPHEDIGHYRIIRGYDRNAHEIIQDDSLQGKDLRYSYGEFITLWQPFNYEYLLIVPEEKKEIVEKILGEELSERAAWENALSRIEAEIQENSDNWHLIFAKSRVHYYLEEYEKSIEEFEKVEDRISFRTLWYQIEPIKSYYELRRYEKVFQITDAILNNQNRAFSELYYIRGQMYLDQGDTALARGEFENAVRYKNNYTPAIEMLKNL